MSLYHKALFPPEDDHLSASPAVGGKQEIEHHSNVLTGSWYLKRVYTLEIGLGNIVPPKKTHCRIFISVDIDNCHDKCQIFISFKFSGRFFAPGWKLWKV